MKTRIAALLIAAAALTSTAFADDAATPPGQAKQAWQQPGPAQRQALRAEHKEAALAKREAWAQKSGAEKAALRQERHRKMEKRHEHHENRRELRQRMGR
ncbi:MAG: hypothetical protein HXY26_07920 [Hydrogenophilaceae bacterium]|nr:hypothetical protein [Hydrogenophilaceae bacterium]